MYTLVSSKILTEMKKKYHGTLVTSQCTNKKLAHNFKNLSLISSDIDTAISNVTQIIKKSTKSAFPTKVMKLRGPKYTISQAMLALVKESKQTLRCWRNAGSLRGEHPLFKQKKKLKRHVRKQNRRERSIDKSRFYNKLMASLDTSYFFKLINVTQGRQTHVLKLHCCKITWK